jgi:hypothetical protein
VAVADFQGYVHWLDPATGALAARAATGDARVTNAPILAGDLLIVISDRGRITAFRTHPLHATETPDVPDTPVAPEPPAEREDGPSEPDAVPREPEVPPPDTDPSSNPLPESGERVP